MMMVTDWQKEFGVPDDVLKGAAPFSGMFDLEPVQLSWRNSYLNLTRDEALRLSPIRRIRDYARMPMVVIGYGATASSTSSSASLRSSPPPGARATIPAPSWCCRASTISMVQQLYNKPGSVLLDAHDPRHDGAAGVAADDGEGAA